MSSWPETGYFMRLLGAWLAVARPCELVLQLRSLVSCLWIFIGRRCTQRVRLYSALILYSRCKRHFIIMKRDPIGKVLFSPGSWMVCPYCRQVYIFGFSPHRYQKPRSLVCILDAAGVLAYWYYCFSGLTAHESSRWSQVIDGSGLALRWPIETIARLVGQLSVPWWRYWC